MNGNYNFISNNVNVRKASKKRLKLFEYLSNNISNIGFIFLRETYSPSRFYIFTRNIFTVKLWTKLEIWFWESSIFFTRKKFSFFFYQRFLSWTLATHRRAGEGRDHLLFHSTTSTRSRTFRHLFVTLHMRYICQTVTRWDRIAIWLIDDVTLIFVCLLDNLILGFFTAIWHEKPVDSNSHRLSPLCFKRTD